MSRIRAFVEVAGQISEQEIDDLEKIGYEAMTVLRYPPPGDDTMAKFGGVNAVGYDPQTGSFTGVGDPRRFGVAEGPRVIAEPSPAN
jgi:hypothetical protein